MYNCLCSSLVVIAINYVEITKFPSNIRAPGRTDVPVCIAELKSTMGRTGVGGAVVGDGLDPQWPGHGGFHRPGGDGYNGSAVGCWL